MNAQRPVLVLESFAQLAHISESTQRVPVHVPAATKHNQRGRKAAGEFVFYDAAFLGLSFDSAHRHTSPRVVRKVSQKHAELRVCGRFQPTIAQMVASPV